jgi:hypothetical protein
MESYDQPLLIDSLTANLHSSEDLTLEVVFVVATMNPTSVRISLGGKLKDKLSELQVSLNPFSQVLIVHTHDFKVSSLAFAMVRGSRTTNSLVHSRAAICRGYDNRPKLITDRL